MAPSRPQVSPRCRCARCRHRRRKWSAWGIRVKGEGVRAEEDEGVHGVKSLGLRVTPAEGSESKDPPSSSIKPRATTPQYQ
eukprot:594755-Rhodomonas_salina.1